MWLVGIPLACVLRSSTSVRSVEYEHNGVYGNFYIKRAIIVLIGLGANQPDDVIHPVNIVDADGSQCPPPSAETRCSRLALLYDVNIAASPHTVAAENDPTAVARRRYEKNRLFLAPVLGLSFAPACEHGAQGFASRRRSFRGASAAHMLSIVGTLSPCHSGAVRQRFTKGNTMVTNFGAYDFLVPPCRVRAAVAAAVLGLSALGMSDESASAQDAQTRCTPDVFRLCSQFIPNRGPIVACLISLRALLSPACRAVFGGTRVASAKKTAKSRKARRAKKAR